MDEYGIAMLEAFSLEDYGFLTADLTAGDKDDCMKFSTPEEANEKLKELLPALDKKYEGATKFAVYELY